MSVSAFIILLLVIAILPGWIAQRKGHGFWGYYVFGVLLWIIATPLALMLKDERRRCPHCAEVVQPAATVCPHCQRELTAESQPPASPDTHA